MSNDFINESTLSDQQLEQLVKEYDNESNFRHITGWLAAFISVVAIGLSLFHVYTAGFGLLNEIAHRTIHLGLVLGLLFLVFPKAKIRHAVSSWINAGIFATFYLYLAWSITNELNDLLNPTVKYGFILLVVLITYSSLPIKKLGGYGDKLSFFDWPMAIMAAAVSLYLTVFFNEIFIQNTGEGQPLDLLMGTLAIIMIFEATRRSMGTVLPLIGLGFLLYAMFGPHFPGILAHRGYDIERIVTHLYLGTEGVYGVAVGVVATYVFHFVLFGVLAQASGLGKLFIDLATIIAGRYSGGPAKVSVVSSGLFGMISGSPIANTVTTGAFTIPMMKKNGLSARFSSAVEASASCGGQVTPPIMGASAFVMTEMLGVPYNEIILIAIIPAAFHYFATLTMVHLEARRLGLTGMSKDKIPQLLAVLKRSWHLLIPLIAMVALLLMQYTPYLAAFWGIILTIVCSWLPLLTNKIGVGDLDSDNVLGPKKLIFSFEMGSKYALGIGAACACVGFILGVTTLSGLGFKFSGAVIQIASDMGSYLAAHIPFDLINEKSATLFFGLVMVGIACIIMGAGIPTTPTYIILASIAAPALYELGVPLIATHFFVFYYGVLADVTPPVALAAYAAAGIGGSEPMRTGVTAFRLSMGKALVPFMFVYAPSLLFINFTWLEFSLALFSGVLSVFALSVAYIGHFKAAVKGYEKVLLSIAGLILIANNLVLIIIGSAIALGILFINILRSKNTPPTIQTRST